MLKGLKGNLFIYGNDIKYIKQYYIFVFKFIYNIYKNIDFLKSEQIEIHRNYKELKDI